MVEKIEQKANILYKLMVNLRIKQKSHFFFLNVNCNFKGEDVEENVLQEIWWPGVGLNTEFWDSMKRNI